MKIHNPQIIMITGATSGFGWATAMEFAQNIPDCKLIITGRRKEKLDELAALIKNDVHILVQDVRDLDQVKADIDNLPDDFKNIDLLVNNAGLALGTAAFPEADLTDHMTMIDTNIKGLTAVTHAVIGGMVKRKRGHVINIGSVAGNYAYPGGNVYCGTKAFVNHFSLALRADLKGKNVRVTAVEPGAVETEFSLVRYKGDQERADKVYETHRSLHAGHIARTIYWVATQPEEMNINSIEIMPTDQSFAGLDTTAVEV